MNPAPARPSFRFLVAAFFISGIMHFVKPASYLSIMPPVLPALLILVYVSGVFEILGGAGLLVPGVRRLAGNGLILLLIAVFPANIYMLTHYLQQHPFDWIAVLFVLRLPLQYVFILIVNRVKK